MRSRGGNGCSVRSERPTEQKRAQRLRQLPRRSARRRPRHAGFAAGGDGSRPHSGSTVFHFHGTHVHIQQNNCCVSSETGFHTEHLVRVLLLEPVSWRSWVRVTYLRCALEH
ncbi:hypothetical protein NDU88_013170 [Pleurodeles waltl]|uniref:Uncharacterized protein n=1 Tax=Pleurodeles waltl TaxID=8319 RepID=A0AAV7R3P6_PLEWA|nr:hypothetical protein NDU88_013170 [Pleurodeles waltl]